MIWIVSDRSLAVAPAGTTIEGKASLIGEADSGLGIAGHSISGADPDAGMTDN